MSLFDDIAHAIGQTIDTLAQDVGADVHVLEGVVSELGGVGIDVLSAAAKLGLSPASFLRGIVDIMNGDPHQRLLGYLTTAMKHMDGPLQVLPQQWTNMASLHQDTAQQIDAHIKELYQNSGTFSYSGPAADMLWNTHQNYQQYFTTLVDHAQTQQVRHTQLSGHVNDYLSQMPGAVYSLPTPLAAFGVLSLDTVATAPPPVLDDPAVQTVEQWIGGTFQTGVQLEEEDPDPEPVSHGVIFIVFAAIIIILVLILIIVVIVIAIRDAFQGHQSQQNSTTTPKPTPGPTPNPVSSMAGDLARQYGVPESVVQDIIDKNPGLSKEEYALLVQYYKKYGTYPYNVRAIFTGLDQNGKSRIYFVTQGDMKHIREHPDALQELSDEELLALIQRLLQEQPDDVVVDKGRKLIDNYYDNVEINGKYYTVIIRMSSSTPGRIISTYVEYDN
ncbi:MAG TPA: hypothetical protein VFV38_37335 [Ktedonobacteraceae bacterium]|nr:hypothetical protein [Ktedonobacteraceae bacterium]